MAVLLLGVPSTVVVDSVAIFMVTSPFGMATSRVGMATSRVGMVTSRVGMMTSRDGIDLIQLLGIS